RANACDWLETDYFLAIDIVHFFLYCHGDLRALHSFPTRRSSDLVRLPLPREPLRPRRRLRERPVPARHGPAAGARRGRPRSGPRSEEHTSELQSLRHLVCRLLLEKKNEPETKKPNLTHNTRRSCA